MYIVKLVYTYISWCPHIHCEVVVLSIQWVAMAVYEQALSAYLHSFHNFLMSPGNHYNKPFTIKVVFNID
ncbi:hypothetical protein Bca101_032255 [Brassica carinata]